MYDFYHVDINGKRVLKGQEEHSIEIEREGLQSMVFLKISHLYEVSRSKMLEVENKK